MALHDYVFPAEWEEQASVILSCPVNPLTWPHNRPLMEKAYAEFVAAISRFQHVRLICLQQAQAHYTELLAQADAKQEHILFYDLSTNDAWCRDHGPIFLRHRQSGKRVILDFNYNAWGGKFSPWDDDQAVPRRMAAKLGLDCFSVPLTCEGGALEVNGAGTLLTTASVLLNENRNPGLDKKEVERILIEFMGLEQVLWLEQGLTGDDTDGHIDTLTRFFRKDAVLTVFDEDPASPNHKTTVENEKALRAMRLPDGSRLEVVRLPCPKPIRPDDWREEILPASYANFLIINDAVLVPTWQQNKTDELALHIIAEAFPERQIIPIDCCEIIWEGGALHCLSQQEPK
ncbi:MAG: agmatine deiminase family protein [Oligosphaeraceae bacterium]|nr:agmatine deiminase family protein [Oligosphaeraceae bacterium]